MPRFLSFGKKFLKKFIYPCLSFFNYNDVVILMYHSIDYNKEFFTVTPEIFAKQMNYLKKNNFNVIKLSDIKTNSIKPKTIILTFDDGYYDNYLNAYPILKKFNFPATFFISSNLINKTIKSRKGTKLKILGQEEIKELAESNLIEIGSHAHNHIKLSSLSDIEIEEELKTSKNKLASIINKEVISLAYPWGDFNENIKNIAKKYYNNICTVHKGRINYNSAKLSLQRNSIDCEVSLAEFKGITKFGRI